MRAISGIHGRRHAHENRLVAGGDAVSLERRFWRSHELQQRMPSVDLPSKRPNTGFREIGSSRPPEARKARHELRSRLTGHRHRRQAISCGMTLPWISGDCSHGGHAFSKAMKRHGPPACLHQCVVTSGRRWESRGVVRTILLMWRLRLMYFLALARRSLPPLRRRAVTR